MPPDARPLRLGYVASRYPALSHTFILREVQALRAAGAVVEVASIRPAAGNDLHDPSNRAEAERTFVVLHDERLRFALGLAAAVLRRPAASARLLRSSLRRRTPGARAALWRLAYGAEALVVWRWAASRDLGHLHAHFANVGSDVAELAAEHGRSLGAGPQTWSFTMHGSTEFYEVVGHRLTAKVSAARFVAVIGLFTRSQLMTHSQPEMWAKLQVVRCGLRLADFPRLPDEARTPTILTVARLVAPKGVDVLLDAMVLVRARVPGAQLVVAGDGPDRERLQGKAFALGLGGAVHFVGAVDQAQLRDLHATSGAFCLPSFAEGVPVVLMEAMALGTPVVTTGIMGTPELVEDGVSGWLVAPGHVGELADALIEVLREPRAARARADAARAVIEDEFDVDASAQRLLRLFGADWSSPGAVATAPAVNGGPVVAGAATT